MFPLSLPEIVVSYFLRFVVRPVLGPPFPIGVQRVWMAFTSLLSQPPPGIHRQKISLGGVDTVMFAPQGVSATGTPGAPVVLYFHGGAFITGSQLTHAGIAGYLAKEIGSVVHLSLYGLAPERPYPAGRDDALKSYRALLDLGVEPGRIIVAGDSAGGAMVADLLLDLAVAGAEQPAGGVLLSPAVGLDQERPAGAGRRDTLVRCAWADIAMNAYRRPSTDAADRILGRDPSLLAGLPAIYLQYSDDELLAAEGRTFGEQLRTAGIDPEIHTDRGSFHILALLPGVMKRARVSIANIGRFARAAVTAAPARDVAPQLDAGSNARIGSLPDAG